MNPFLIRRPAGAASRFDADTELAEFLNSLDRYHTIEELRTLLIARFGRERTPSKSSIHRYLQKMTSQANREG